MIHQASLIPTQPGGLASASFSVSRFSFQVSGWFAVDGCSFCFSFSAPALTPVHFTLSPCEYYPGLSGGPAPGVAFIEWDS